MDFSLILSGPILPRVEPTLVSVQVALRESCRVRLSLFEGLVADDSGGRLFSKTPVTQSEEEPTIRVGEKLHLAVVMLNLPDTKALLSSRLYSYNLTERRAATRSEIPWAAAGSGGQLRRPRRCGCDAVPWPVPMARRRPSVRKVAF